MSARMGLHVALCLRLDAIEAHRLANAYRAEVLREAADRHEQSADEAEAAVMAHYGHGIGRGSADMLRLAAKDLRQMADEAGKDTRTGESSTEYGIHVPANDTEPEPTVLHVTTSRADAEDQLRHHRSIWPGYGQTLVQRTVTTGPWAPAATGGEPRG